MRLIWGDDVEPEIRPLLYVGLAGSLSASSMWTFMGIWTVDKLHADSSSLAVALLVGACLAAATGYVSGHLSDRVGRRPLILAGWAILTGYELLFVLVGERTTLGLVVLAGAGMSGSIGWAAHPGLRRRPRSARAPRVGVRVAASGEQPGCRRWPGSRGCAASRLVVGAVPGRVRADRGRVRARVAAAPASRGLRARGDARAWLVRRHPPRPRLRPLPSLDRARVHRLRGLRDRAADLARRQSRPCAVHVGLPRDPEPPDGHALPAPPDALDVAHLPAAQAGCGDHVDGAAIPRAVGQCGDPRRPRRHLRVRRRRDALGADLAGGRGGPRSPGSARRVPRRVLEHGRGRLRVGALHGPARP